MDNAETPGQRVLRAADADGFDLKGPLGETMKALASVADTIHAGTRIADAQVERVNAAVDMARASVRKAEVERERQKVEQDKALTDLVATLTDRIEAGLKGALVIKQRARDRKLLIRDYILATVVVCAVSCFWYGLRAWQDQDAVRFLARCLKDAVVARDGTLFCPIGSAAGTRGNT